MAFLLTVMPMQLTGYAAEEEGFPIQLVSTPEISPAGTHLAFSWVGDIWIANVDGSGLTRITTHASIDTSPKFSPDGTELAFVSSRTGSDQVFLVDLSIGKRVPTTVGTPHQVTHHSEGYQLHGWFPDGNHVLATGIRDHGWKYPRRMIRVNVRERRNEQVLADAIADQPAIAIDGNRVLFVREGSRWWRKGYTGERAAQIWIYDIEAEEFTELLHIGVDCRHPKWDGDREAFFFTKGSYLGASLCRFDMITGEHTEVAAFDDDSIVMPSVSADGKHLIFRHLFDFYHCELGEDRPLDKPKPKKISLNYQGDSLTLDDEMRRRLDRASDVAFSADGLEMIFTSGGDLWSMDTKLKEPVRLSDTPGFETSPVLTDEAAFVVSVQEGQTDIWKLTRPEDQPYWWQTESPQWTRLTNTPDVESNLQISPDGKHLYFTRMPGDLMRMSVDGDQPTPIAQGFSTPDFDLSSCGTWIAYTLEDDNFNDDVWITKADGSGQPYNVSKHPDDDGNPRFSSDGKILAFTGRRIDTETDIYYVYLQADQAEETSRERRLKEAIETMEKKRKAKPELETKDDPNEQDDDSPSEKDDDAPSDEDKDEEDAEDEDEDKDESAPIEIDFDGLDDRVKRISVGDSDQYKLAWSPDGSKLVFNASIDGDSGMYSVTFPDELQPKKFSESTIQVKTWSKKSGGLLGLISGSPAKLNDEGKPEKYDFSVRQTYRRGAKFGEAFDQAWRVMRDRWYDPKMGGRNWNEVRRKYESAAEMSVTSAMFGEIIKLMLGELNGSHNGFNPTRDEPSSPRPEFIDRTAHLGARFDFRDNGPGLLIQDVLPDTPADRTGSKLKPGDRIMTIDGTVVDPLMDLTLVLNGPIDRDILLTVQRANAEKKNDPVPITIRPTSFDTARNQLYEHWLEHNRRLVTEGSKGKLGYLHIRAMNMPSFYEFEKQLYRVGYDREGLVIDVRDNGGGWITDRLLTALTQPRHAITVPRDGGPGYPQDRMVYATWQKPIVVLCNQNSFSNAEIFSHAIRNLRRGKLVGVQTAGGVISTGAVQIMDMGTMRMPFRGWFTAVDGEDMERKGAIPHHVIWPAPGEIPSGKDRQLQKAIKVLLKEVRRDKKTNPMPKLIYDSKRKDS
ncbi:S41 family peptidase [Rubripirellula obstinata]|uniref:S41 family peptidase n=1 Tax=Rubripirellula obstinata TaxID=406547 RepID=UPI00122C2BB0|nr:S41 family peptidase [Rubripirellula obstinata]